MLEVHHNRCRFARCCKATAGAVAVAAGSSDENGVIGDPDGVGARAEFWSMDDNDCHATEVE